MIAFAEWFRKNFPGPYTIVHKPDWHSPKIFRAVIAALAKANYQIAAPGFRILGPDEVDQVTVEKCAEVTEMYVSMGWRGTEITEALRAIGRKAQ